LSVLILIFAFYSPIFRGREEGETVMFYGLEGKFFGGSGISLTTLYVVLLSLGDTQYRHFVVRGTQKF